MGRGQVTVALKNVTGKPLRFQPPFLNLWGLSTLGAAGVLMAKVVLNSLSHILGKTDENFSACYFQVQESSVASFVQNMNI